MGVWLDWTALMGQGNDFSEFGTGLYGYVDLLNVLCGDFALVAIVSISCRSLEKMGLLDLNLVEILKFALWVNSSFQEEKNYYRNCGSSKRVTTKPSLCHSIGRRKWVEGG
jgi:hypothetical protein